MTIQLQGSTIKFGLFVPQGWKMDLVEIADPVAKYEAMTRVAREADKGPWDSIWVFDHFHTVPTPEKEATFEAWTISAGLARDTQRVKVGQVVTCNGYRNPALLAKMASTVDVMSHGRLMFGFGAGWYEHEWRAYGYGYPDTRQRMAMFREATEIIYRMWMEEKPVFHGQHYTIDGPINEPRGARTPHPFFLIGGGGEQVTLKLVAKYGDACNFFGSIDVVRHKLDVLRQHCDAVGRDDNEIVRSAILDIHLIENDAEAESATALARGALSYEDYARQNWVGTPDHIIERLRPYIDLGMNYFMIYLPRIAYGLEQAQWFAESVIAKI